MSNNNSKQVPTIIVCLDTTTTSNVVLRYACYKARRAGFAVQILGVIESSYRSLLFVSKIVGKDKRLELERHFKRVIGEVYDETNIMPSVSIREGDVTTEIVNEIKSNSDCIMLILGKSHNSLSDNKVLPKISTQIGDKIRIPITIVPENLSEEYLQRLV